MVTSGRKSVAQGNNHTDVELALSITRRRVVLV